jgi:hypothetical protein
MLKLADVSEVRTASIVRAMMEDGFIALIMEAVSISETSVNFNMTTWRCIPEDSKLHKKMIMTGNTERFL